jgi:signal peptidase I
VATIRTVVRRKVREWRTPLLFLLLMLGFRSAWADWVDVPTGSMNPTILEGDRLLVDKHVYGLRVPFTRLQLTAGRNPARGEIVVFDSPANGTSLVKRVVGIPGDRVELVGERLIVNGVGASYAPGDARALATLVAATRAEGPVVVSEAAATRHDILLLPGRPALRSVAPFTVPDGMYFMLGDNRDNSADSRYIGLVPRRNVVGRATRILASFDPDRYHLPRSARLLLPLA